MNTFVCPNDGALAPLTIAAAESPDEYLTNAWNTSMPLDTYKQETFILVD